MTEEVSRVAAPCVLSVVDGEEVEMSRLCEDRVFVEGSVVACFKDDVGDGADLGGFVDPVEVSLC